ncbi:hypothetical protein KR044_005571, partial [Drosophila immigrans]
TNEKKPIVRHINQAMKDSLAQMKRIQTALCEQLQEIGSQHNSCQAGIHKGDEAPTQKKDASTSPLGTELALKEKPASSRAPPNAPRRRKEAPKPSMEKPANPRAAPSAPAVKTGGKRQTTPSQVREDKPDEGTWRTVKPRPRPSARQRGSRPDALLVKCKDSTSYAAVLTAVQTDSALQEYKEKVCKIRRTAAGELLLQLVKAGDDSTSMLLEAVQKTVGGIAQVKSISERSELEIRDISEWTTAEDVLQAIAVKLAINITDEFSAKLRAAYGGTQTARVILPANVGIALTELKKIRIGWAVCRV